MALQTSHSPERRLGVPSDLKISMLSVTVTNMEVGEGVVGSKCLLVYRGMFCGPYVHSNSNRVY